MCPAQGQLSDCHATLHLLTIMADGDAAAAMPLCYFPFHSGVIKLG
jgi:hypothetical protein